MGHLVEQRQGKAIQSHILGKPVIAAAGSSGWLAGERGGGGSQRRASSSSSRTVSPQTFLTQARTRLLHVPMVTTLLVVSPHCTGDRHTSNENPEKHRGCTPISHKSLSRQDREIKVSQCVGKVHPGISTKPSINIRRAMEGFRKKKKAINYRLLTDLGNDIIILRVMPRNSILFILTAHLHLSLRLQQLV